ncbi:DUF3987 domain-containing protein [Burkholderia pseudomallei]|uniref:DUF3987 domain-containing protein n=1 Tax=Burkholderia pseudomallei TaxID=28450 RepID=UPI000F074AD2|nr:DUF3987 domain-containing protein [Burkholderia pseudomallei]VBQ11434.1 Uncharacterised protein [Burkholderia pseudomallei]
MLVRNHDTQSVDPDQFPDYALTPTLLRIATALIDAKRISGAIAIPILNNGAAFAVSPRFRIKLPGGGCKPVNNMGWVTSPSAQGRSVSGDLLYRPFHDRMFRADACDSVNLKIKIPLSVFHNSTPEAAIRRMPGGLAAGIVDDEGAFVRNPRFVPNLSVFNRGFDDAPIIIDTKRGGRIAVESPNLSAIFLTQPEVTRRFDARHGELFRSSGAASRCNVVHIPNLTSPRFISTDLQPELDMSEWNDLVNAHWDEAELNIARGITERDELSFDAQAGRCLTSLHNEYMTRTMPGGDLAALPEHGGRQMENAARLAGVFHAFEQMSGRISSETVERAALIVRWHTEHYKRRFMPAPTVPREYEEADHLAEWLCGFVYRTGTLSVRRSDLRAHAPEMGLSKPAVERALTVLCSSNYARIVLGKSAWIELNPAYFHPRRHVSPWPLHAQF